jgi:outer membrane protein
MTPPRAVAAAVVLFLGSSASGTTVDGAIAAALAHAPEIDAAKAEHDIAKGRLEQARSGGLPSASISGTVGYGRLDPLGFFGLDAAYVTPWAVQATVEQPVFTGGRVGAEVARAKAGIVAADAGMTSVRSQVVVAVAQAYGDVLAAREVVALYSGQVSQTQEIERQAKERFRVGESPSTDVSQAASRLAEAQAALAKAQGAQVTADTRYRNLTGVDPVDLQPLPPNPPLPPTLDEAMETAADKNPVLQRAKAALRAAEAGARGARAERLPTISSFVEAGAVRDQFFPGYKANSVTVGIKGNWNFFTGGRVSGKIDEANGEVRASEAQLRTAEAALREKVVAAWQDVRTTELVETASQEQAAAATEALRSVGHEVRVGMKPQIELLDAQREATAADANAAQARTARIVAAYRLLSLLGDF